MEKFIHIRSAKSPILPGEKEELVNEGMYGKALAKYLQIKLKERGYDPPFICCEDWGWWVELKAAPFTFGFPAMPIERLRVRAFLNLRSSILNPRHPSFPSFFPCVFAS